MMKFVTENSLMMSVRKPRDHGWRCSPLAPNCLVFVSFATSIDQNGGAQGAFTNLEDWSF